MEKKLTVQLEEELIYRFRLVAMRDGRTMSEIVRGFVQAYVEQKEKEDRERVRAVSQ